MAFGFGFGMPRSFATPFSPASLFATGAPGTWYDPSDINLNWRYNLLTYTEQFDNAVWAKGAATVSANATTAPDGTLTADRLVETTATNFHFVRPATAVAVTPGASYVFSCFLKQGERRYGGINHDDGTARGCSVDLLTGELGTPYGGATASVVDAGNGFWRLSVTATLTSATNLPAVYVSNTNALASYTGDGTSGIYIWGASLTTAANASLPYQQIVTPEISYLNYQAQPILYQDSAGTTPVTAVEQPVGLMLDKSQGLVLGPELVTNGTFDTNITGWVVGNAGQSTLAWSDGKLRITRVNAGDTYPNARTTLTGLTVGRIYKIVSATNNPFGIEAYHSIAGIALSTVRTTLASKTLECVFTATATSHNLDVGIWATSGSAGQYVEFDNISVRELPGNHAFQSTAASRPVLSARYNLLTKTEQFDDAAWVKSGGTPATINANAAVAPDGTMTADQLNLAAVSAPGAFCLVFQSPTQAFSTAHTGSVYLRGIVGGETLWIMWTPDGTTYARVQCTLTTSWQRFSLPYTTSASGLQYFQIGVDLRDATQTARPAQSVYIWGASLVPANQSTLPYQRVNTSTDYNTVGFLPYLKFDGVDDSLSTNSINFTSTDKMSVFAGVRKLSDAASGMLVNLSANTGSETGVFFMWAPFSTTFEYAVQSRGTEASSSTQRLAIDNSAYAAPVTNTITGLFDIPNDSSAARINGVSAGSATGDQGVGSFGNYPIFIGRVGGTTLPFNGQLYSMIIVGKAVQAGELTSSETYTASKTGVTLA